MEIAQGYARQPKRIYAVEKCGFFHFVITLGYPFCTNFLQTFLMKKVQICSYFVVLCWFLRYVSLKLDVIFSAPIESISFSGSVWNIWKHSFSYRTPMWIIWAKSYKAPLRLQNLILPYEPYKCPIWANLTFFEKVDF